MFNRIRPVIQRRPPVILSLRELVKDLIPEPDAKIVNRLISYFPSNNFKIRAPWSLLPNNVATYDLENVKFYARILTMLAQLGVYPPVKTQIQGITPSKIFSTFSPSFDGPIQISPSGSASRRFLRRTSSSEETKHNVLSDSEGSLSDASEGMLSDVESDGENQVIELTEFWKHSREPFDNSPNNVEQSEFKTPRGSSSIDREQFDDIDLDEFMDENVVRQNYVQDPEEDHEMDVFEEPFSMNIIRESATWSQRIRRRLPWSRLSRPRQVEIELELSPIWVISDDDLEEMQLEIPLPEPQLTW